MTLAALYDFPTVYDQIMQPGPCEAFYGDLARETGGPVLELACGTGRLTVPLACQGHAIVGLDASPAMLAHARRKAASANVEVLFGLFAAMVVVLRDVGGFALISIAYARCIKVRARKERGVKLRLRLTVRGREPSLGSILRAVGIGNRDRRVVGAFAMGQALTRAFRSSEFEERPTHVSVESAYSLEAAAGTAIGGRSSSRDDPNCPHVRETPPRGRPAADIVGGGRFRSRQLVRTRRDRVSRPISRALQTGL